jgi:L-serine dehydratase
MCNSVKRGLNSTGLLPGSLHVERKAKYLYDNFKNDKDVSKRIYSYAYAAMEENATGGIIVTAPTCGSSGVLASIVYYLFNDLHIEKSKIINGLAVAGLIGTIIKTNATISGAVGGCQAEIGSACSMASALYGYVLNFNIDMIECAIEISLEHILGLTCDPVNGYVQIPCIERNAVSAMRAIDSCNLGVYLSGYKKVSFDTVVKTMYETGLDLSIKYKETSLAGLAKNYGKDGTNCW